MFHTSHIHVPRNGRPSALRTFVTSSSFGSTETKEPLRRGILFTTVASVLLLVGSILTWLGFNDVFGGKVSMTGPLLIALALLLLLLSMRQFLIARKRNNSTRNGLQGEDGIGNGSVMDPFKSELRPASYLGQMGRGTVTAVVVDRNDGVGAVTVVMDSHSIDQETHFRNSASSTLEDYEPPSYSEVTQCLPGNPPLCAQPVVCQDEPPPPYEEAVVGDGSSCILTRSTGQTEESAPAYSPQGHTGYTLDRGSNLMTIPGQVPGSQCYHCCMFPTPTGLDANSGGRLMTHSLSTGQVLGAQELTQGSNRHWSSPRRFVLIPHFLGIFSNGSADPAQSMTGELPPAYQAVDTTGRSPLTYVQAMGLSNPQPVGSDHLGIQSPHESRPPASQTIPEQPVDTYHPPRTKDCISPGVVPISNLAFTGSNQPGTSPNCSQSCSSVPGSISLSCDTFPSSNRQGCPLPSPTVPGSCSTSHACPSGSLCPNLTLPTVSHPSPGVSCYHSPTGTHISICSHASSNIPAASVPASPHPNSSSPGSSPLVTSNVTSPVTPGTCHLTTTSINSTAGPNAPRTTYTAPRFLMTQHSSSSPIVDELEEVL